jgi:hypothetical protein
LSPAPILNEGMRRLRLVHPVPRSRPAARPEIDPAVQALLEQVRIIAPLPRVVRARALARAYAALGAAVVRSRRAPS